MSVSEPLSVVVTTFENADTLDACLRSVRWAEEIVVLDSGSTDATLAIATHYGARIHSQPFAGYSAQKQAAIDLATHDWVLLLDSDESLAYDAAVKIRHALLSPSCAGYQLWRREWQFWRWQSAHSRLNRYVRLFDRKRARVSDHAVHETVVVEGRAGELNILIDHHGEADISGRVDKANRYSGMQLADLSRRHPSWLRLRIVAYPALAFLRYYLLRGHWRSGWAGFIAARIHAFYSFLKYAKYYEEKRRSSRRSDVGNVED